MAAMRDERRSQPIALAALCAMSVAAVATLRAVLDQGAIRYLRAKVRVVDRPLLERQTCECYFVIRRLAERSGFLSR